MPIKPDPMPPEVADFVLTQKPSILGTLPEANDQAKRKIKTGDHVIDRYRRIAPEWTPEDKGALKFRDDVIERLERLENGLPDYDTGYFLVEKGWNYYTIAHDLGRVPTRHSIYCDTQGTDEPINSKNAVYQMIPRVMWYWDDTGGVYKTYGIYLSHAVAGDRSYIVTAGDYILAPEYAPYESMYIRVLLWR